MDAPRIVLVHDQPGAISETFIRAHIDRLPNVVAVLHSPAALPIIERGTVPEVGPWIRLRRRVANIVFRRDWSVHVMHAWESALRGVGADVALAEFGTTGGRLIPYCERIGMPLVVHFHGYDATRVDVLARNRDAYLRVFARSAAIIVVSRAMARQLIGLGCPRDKVLYNPYGVDCETFTGGLPASAPPHLVAVGRMVEKKGPHLTLVAFARVITQCPEARLIMIGEGPLLGACRDLVAALGIAHAVDLRGAQPHEAVLRELKVARAFVQHSITASDGDSEGTPVAVLEAGATGLPVVSTRHAGIPDVILDGVTGLLVDERDVSAMAVHMLKLLRDPTVASEMGQNAAAHVRRHYDMKDSIDRLLRILVAAASRESLETVRQSIERELPA